MLKWSMEGHENVNVYLTFVLDLPQKQSLARKKICLLKRGVDSHYLEQFDGGVDTNGTNAGGLSTKISYTGSGSSQEYNDQISQSTMIKFQREEHKKDTDNTVAMGAHTRTEKGKQRKKQVVCKTTL
uniref:Uncharacterized protein n=1 Tax=Dunaliella tertiolecta TaxID=3047 RepID=A0A7S3R1C3_DUNTE